MNGEEQLKEELEKFKEDKEKIKKIINEIDGTSKKQNRIVNILLIFIIFILILLGVVFQKIDPVIAVQVAILFGVIKLIWMFYEAQRMSHFQFWIMNSMEFRINEIHKIVRKLEKEKNQK